jgi:AraC-like DNA-binding protein
MTKLSKKKNLSDQVDKWVTKYSPQFFSDKDGFVELPYLANSPESMIKSMIRLPSVQHSEKDQTLIPSNPYLKGTVHYEELEEGLWIIHGDFEYLVNINAKRIRDEQLPMDYYFLSLNIINSEEKEKPALVNGMPYNLRTWLFFKPGASEVSCHFKGSRELSFSIFFSERWLREVLYNNLPFLSSSFKQFFDSEATFLIWPDTVESTDQIYTSLQTVILEKGEKGVLDKVKLRNQSYDLLFQFIHKYNTEEFGQNYYQVSVGNRTKIRNAERLLFESIKGPFMGIDDLAGQIGISPTLLKTNFKLVFGLSVFQYFRKKQMEYAHLILQSNTMTIREVAQILGYENSIKFSAAFLKTLGILPSQMKSK